MGVVYFSIITTFEPSRYCKCWIVCFYYMNNPDLQSVVGLDSQKLFEHFYTCGMAEGRRASENFDVSVYKANNPDLAAVFGDDLKAYYTHYVQSGQLENRVCK